MKDTVEQRVCELAVYIIETGATVRIAAKHFGISKSTVHKDISERLKILSPKKAKLAKQILETNKSERHIRGGNATKIKYEKLKI